MTWPFENDTSAIVKKLAKRNMRADRKNVFLLICTIAVSVGMIYSIILASAGADQAFKNAKQNKAQITVVGATDEQLAEIRALPDISWVGEMSYIGFFYKEHSSFTPTYMDETYLEREAGVSYTGRIPQTENEIMLSDNYIRDYGLKCDIGDSIILDVTGTGDENSYTISGIINDNKTRNNYRLYLSKSLSNKLLDGKLQTTAYTRMNTELIRTNDLEKLAEQILTPIGIIPGQIFLTDYSGVMTGIKKPDIPVPVELLAAVVAILAGIVIYGIFYTMVTKNVQTLGQLRTIGMTKRQINKMSNKESRQFIYKGIPVGLLLGAGVGFLFSPDGFEARTAIRWAIIISVVVYFIVMIATSKPTRIAMKTSPLEGTKYTTYDVKWQYSRKLNRHLSLSNLALLNIERNKKKAIFTVSALGISLAVLLATTTVGNSIDARKSSEFRFFPFGQIQIRIQNIARSSFDDNSEQFRSTRLQLENNPLENPILIKTLEEMDGVDSVTSSSALFLGISFHDRMLSTTTIADMVPTINRQQFEIIRPVLSDVTLVYDDIVSRKAILTSGSIANVGDMLQLEGRAPDGTTFHEDVFVIATYDSSKLMETLPLVPGSPDFLITSDTAANFTGVSRQTGVLSIAVRDNAYDQVSSAIQNLVNESDEIDTYTIDDNIRNIERIYDQRIKTFYFIALAIFVFGCVSLVNMLLVDYQNRRQELGLLRAVGATQPQLRKMLRIETLSYLSYSILFATIGGTLFGILFCNRLEKIHHCIDFCYPFYIILMMITGTAIIHLIVSVCIAKSMKSERIIDAIKAE